MVKPFFHEHIVRLDRQIILVDTLNAINDGSEAVSDLENTLCEILSCFRAGKNNFINQLWQHRIERILVASTKADHLHHENHDILQHLTQQIVAKSIGEAGINGAKIQSLALASLRTTHEGTINQSGDILPVIIGTPMAGEVLDKHVFDGNTQTAIFPGDLPKNLSEIEQNSKREKTNFIKFRPPHINPNETLAHIRLDRALEFLIGDYLI